MSAMAKLVMQKFYRQANGRPELVPWHRDEPEGVLIDAIEARNGRGRVLDVGCGTGAFAVWMAERGMEVTALDLFPEALDMGRALAAKKGVAVEFVCADLFDYAPERPFDVVLDSGCLHSLVGGSVAVYKRQVLRWLAPGGELVLGHWGKRHAFDWRPIGPRRRSEATIRKIFAPELIPTHTEVVDFETPLPFGPVVRGIGYRFVRAS
ncbi:SAM-dependent methyltransferase [Vulgatibacter incomptus]|uniref:Methyltransferase n=1 Tax=Vulgatibacter incomptus TaxID=1391653 RepID=A0A0K1PA76_9BACT|nr:class I SAM-dependent methyltransferase [Vulgatibacter incomptus]AKU90420.1 Methyltransferase [Vulgatibacter incomptus]